MKGFTVRVVTTDISLAGDITAIPDIVTYGGTSAGPAEQQALGVYVVGQMAPRLGALGIRQALRDEHGAEMPRRAYDGAKTRLRHLAANVVTIDAHSAASRWLLTGLPPGEQEHPLEGRIRESIDELWPIKRSIAALQRYGDHARHSSLLS
jgi:hypothetical protein